LNLQLYSHRISGLVKFFGVFVLLGHGLFAQDAPPDLQHALEVVHEHVDRLETSVPNFICKEQISSRLYLNNKLKQETKAQSVLTTVRVKKEYSNEFSESRAEMTINGKRSKRNDIPGPFVWRGGPAYGDLHFLFNSDRGSLCLERQLLGTVKLGERDALLIKTHASSAVGSDADCREMHMDSADNIWLDPQTLNVMRIESHNPPATPIPGADLTLTVDYAPVVFDGAEYWLPSHFISQLDFPGTPKHFQYESYFSEYHKFGAESVVHIDPVQ
jgi:hypothetical protein